MSKTLLILLLIYGVSSEFAMSRMDEENHPEIDIFVEDESARVLLEEIIAYADLSLLPRVQIVPYGAASVGKALGIMVSEDRFPRATMVFLDGDQDESSGCLVLPGDDAPERVIYQELIALGFPGVADNLARSHSDLVDNCRLAATTSDHHSWNQSVADRIVCSKNDLWRALCRSWVVHVYKPDHNNFIVESIREEIQLYSV